jgi:hypothetical protein
MSSSPESTPNPSPENATAITPAANVPSGTAAVQEDVVYLPEPKPQPPLDQLASHERRPHPLRQRADLVLAVLVVVLAFLMGSFAIRNPDAFLHLATGRYLTEQGLGQVGVDPFTYTAEGVLWVNSSWLFDLLVYWLYQLGQGPALAVARAVVVALLAVCILQTRPRGGSLWTSTAMLVLALLAMAMSSRFLFQPTVVSYLLLAVTVYLLLRRPGGADQGSAKTAKSFALFDPRFRSLWLLPPLFMLWANLDGWFILGPLVVGLALVGEAVEALIGQSEQQPGHAQPWARCATLAVVFGVGLLACMLNPFLFRVFRLPQELGYLVQDYLGAGISPGGQVLHAIKETDETFLEQIALWVSLSQVLESGRGIDATLIFLVMLVLGLLSFVGLLVLGRDRAGDTNRIPRLLIWVVLAGMSLLLVRLMPFFLVVAAPITAWNWQEVARRVSTRGTQLERLALLWSVAGRVVSLAVVALLLFLVWPGLFDSRSRVAWSLEPNQSLKETAELLGQWQTGKNVKHVFNFNPDMGCYCAWYCPGVKYYYDFRFDLLEGRGEALGKLRKSLLPPSVIGDIAENKVNPRLVAAHRKLLAFRDKNFAKLRITHVLMSGRRWSFPAVPTLLGDLSSQWRLAAGNGESVVFRWGQSSKAFHDDDPADGLDANALAFAKKAVWRPDPDTIALPQPLGFWQMYWHGEKDPSVEVGRARFYLACHTTRMEGQELFYRKVGRHCQFLLTLGGAVAAAPGRAGSLTMCESSLAGMLTAQVPPGIDLSFAVLAVRSARKAVRDDPNDPTAHAVLANAYVSLGQAENAKANLILDFWLRENAVLAANGVVPPQRFLHKRLRLIQKVTSWQNRLTLLPDDYELHLQFARYYDYQLSFKGPPNLFVAKFFEDRQMFPDLALDHLTKARELLNRAPSLPKELQELKKTIDAHYESLKKAVEHARNVFRKDSRSYPLQKKVKAALEYRFSIQIGKGPGQVWRDHLGLAKEALKILAEADLKKDLSPEDRSFVIHTWASLLLMMGRVQEMKAVMDKLPRDHPLRPMLECDYAAAVGAPELYDRAMKQLEDRAFKNMITVLFQSQETRPPMAISLMPEPVPISGALVPLPLSHILGLKLQRDLAAHYLANLSDHRLLRGLMAMEVGDVARAEELLQGSLDLDYPTDSLPIRSVAELYLFQIRQANVKR